MANHVAREQGRRLIERIKNGMDVYDSSGDHIGTVDEIYLGEASAGERDKEGYRAAALQGNMSQNRRQHAIDGFRDGKYDLLVATDIAARGIDVEYISHVINFDMPDTVDAYTHRIGRTGRAEETGEAFTLAAPDDAAMVRDIENVLNTSLERRRLADFDYGDFMPEGQLRQGSSNGEQKKSPSSSNGSRTANKSRRTNKNSASSNGSAKKSSMNAPSDSRRRRRRRRSSRPN